MSRQFKPQIVTANDLFEGDVVYLTAENGWSRFHAEAAIAKDAEMAEAMIETAKSQPGRIVGPYLATVEVDADGAPRPSHFRETFRTCGPSNYFDGKQADLADGSSDRTKETR
jgi:hypothetical protein